MLFQFKTESNGLGPRPPRQGRSIEKDHPFNINAQDNQEGRLLHDLQPIDYKTLIIIDLISIGRLEFPHYIPLFKKEFTGPPKMLLG